MQQIEARGAERTQTRVRRLQGKKNWAWVDRIVDIKNNDKKGNGYGHSLGYETAILG